MATPKTVLCQAIRPDVFDPSVLRHAREYLSLYHGGYDPPLLLCKFEVRKESNAQSCAVTVKFIKTEMSKFLRKMETDMELSEISTEKPLSDEAILEAKAYSLKIPFYPKFVVPSGVLAWESYSLDMLPEPYNQLEEKYGHQPSRGYNRMRIDNNSIPGADPNIRHKFCRVCKTIGGIQYSHLIPKSPRGTDFTKNFGAEWARTSSRRDINDRTQNSITLSFVIHEFLDKGNLIFVPHPLRGRKTDSGHSISDEAWTIFVLDSEECTLFYDWHMTAEINMNGICGFSLMGNSIFSWCARTKEFGSSASNDGQWPSLSVRLSDEIADVIRSDRGGVHHKPSKKRTGSQGPSSSSPKKKPRTGDLQTPVASSDTDSIAKQ